MTSERREAGKMCTCLGTCKGAAGLAPGWVCALLPATPEPPKGGVCSGCGADPGQPCLCGNRELLDKLKERDATLEQMRTAHDEYLKLTDAGMDQAAAKIEELEASLELLRREKGLSFAELREKNVSRCEASFFPVASWNPLEWAGALCGEAGEAANLAKKLKRGQPIDPKDIGRECADVVTYCDLLCAALGIDLGEILCDKFNEVSDRVKSEIKFALYQERHGGRGEGL